MSPAFERARLNSLLKKPDRFLVLKGRSFSCASEIDPDPTRREAPRKRRIAKELCDPVR
jgi:hypothetical protein